MLRILMQIDEKKTLNKVGICAEPYLLLLLSTMRNKNKSTRTGRGGGAGDNCVWPRLVDPEEDP